jgi:predicted 2-oxoglutarate/Fe(II)-dependent dioxygenase YbiX
MTQEPEQEITPTVQDKSSEFFANKRYVLLNGAMPPAQCAELSTYLRKLAQDGIATPDAQCPKSAAIYGDPVMDKILADFTIPVGENVGLDLHPTYSYARVYQPGEVLERHIDREACEISGTMTLGFDADAVWPIYVAQGEEDIAGSRVDLEVGDLLMYRGNEIPHWRREFKGEWQCQVFLHYIDKNGPHKDKGLEFDGRPELGLGPSSKQQVTPEGEVSLEERQRILKERLNMSTSQRDHTDLSIDIDDDFARQEANIDESGDACIVQPMQQSRTGVFPIFGGVMIPSWDLELPGAATYTQENYPALTFNAEECQAIIDFSKTYYQEAGTVGAGTEGEVSKIRVVDLYNIPMNEKTQWVFDRISRLASVANNEYFKFDIMGITHELQLLHYKTDEKPGHYDWHVDMGGGQSSTRKLSVSAQLSNPAEYTGGELILNNNGQYVKGSQSRGSITCFPSYFLHKVKPMESGERWALVIWVHGSGRFR